MNKIFDNLHGFIEYAEPIGRLIHSRPFQRLRHIHQMGVTYLLYPGAMHTRWEHSLGVMHIALKIFDHLLIDCSHVGSRAVRLYLKEEIGESIEYWRAVLAMAALCHDIGHPPLSHVAEQQLLPRGHEEMTAQLVRSPELSSIWKALQEHYRVKRSVADDITKIAVGPEHLQALNSPLKLTAWEELLARIITDDYVGADRIDYLLRDARNTGVTHGLFDHLQLIDSLLIMDSDQMRGSTTNPSSAYPRIGLGISISGVKSVEALILARYFMHSRVYRHPEVHAYSLHLRNFIALEPSLAHYDFADLQAFLELTDHEVLSKIAQAAHQIDHPAHAHARALYYQENRHLPIRRLSPPSLSASSIARLKQRFGAQLLTDPQRSRSSQKEPRYKNSAPLSIWIEGEGRSATIEEVSPLLEHIPYVANADLYALPEAQAAIADCLDANS